MTPLPPLPDFLRPLETLVRPFPRAAMEEAIARREESTPHLLAAIEWVADDPEAMFAVEPPYMLHIYALYLLAQFREPRALAPTLRLFRLPDDEEIAGTIATEGLARILASVCGGDLGPIRELAEDRAVDEFVRAAAVEALGALAHCALQPRTAISEYFGELFRGRLEREPSFVWDQLVGVCADLRMAEHLDAIRAAYHDGFTDPQVMPLRDAERAIARPLAPSSEDLERYHLIDDAIAELEGWYCFDPASAEDDFATDDLDLGEDYDEPGIPLVRETPKVGRNDLCPCGSGKKFKKCCGKAG